jgi:hypothetical protein
LLCDLAAKYIERRKKQGDFWGEKTGKKRGKEEKMGQNTSKIRSKIQKNGAKI